MKKKKYISTRKRRSVKLLTAIAVLLALTFVTNAYFFTPGQLIKYTAEQLGVENPKVVLHMRDNGIPGSGVWLAEDGDKAVSLQTRFGLFGWQSHNCDLFSKTGTGAARGARWGTDNEMYAVGCIKNPGAVLAKAEIKDTAGNLYPMDVTQNVKDGTLYYIAHTKLEGNPSINWGPAFVVSYYDADGKLLGYEDWEQS